MKSKNGQILIKVLIILSCFMNTFVRFIKSTLLVEFREVSVMSVLFVTHRRHVMTMTSLMFLPIKPVSDIILIIVPAHQPRPKGITGATISTSNVPEYSCRQYGPWDAIVRIRDDAMHYPEQGISQCHEILCCLSLFTYNSSCLTHNSFESHFYRECRGYFHFQGKGLQRLLLNLGFLHFRFYPIVLQHMAIVKQDNKRCA